jgi:hypothetical protein
MFSFDLNVVHCADQKHSVVEALTVLIYLK